MRLYCCSYVFVIHPSNYYFMPLPLKSHCAPFLSTLPCKFNDSNPIPRNLWPHNNLAFTSYCPHHINIVSFIIALQTLELTYPFSTRFIQILTLTKPLFSSK